MAHRHAKLMIVGSGPAGYTAAIYAARALLDPVMVSGFQPGGQLMITTDVENYPGYADVIQGPWLMEQMRLQAEHVGTHMVSDHIVKVELGSRPFRLEGDSGDTYSCDALVIATGAQAKWLGLPSEAKFQGFGVSACATCDGFFFRGKEVVVVGGGNTAVEEALYLSHLASKVTLVHRRDSFAPSASSRTGCSSIPRSEWSGLRRRGDLRHEDPASVTHVRLRNLNRARRLKTDGVFIAIGHKPSTELFAGQLDMKAAATSDHGRLTPPTSRASSRPATSRRRLPSGRDSGGHGLYGSP
jgi:thioredoxin reductase (NADPH)